MVEVAADLTKNRNRPGTLETTVLHAVMGETEIILRNLTLPAAALVAVTAEAEAATAIATATASQPIQEITTNLDDKKTTNLIREKTESESFRFNCLRT